MSSSLVEENEELQISELDSDLPSLASQAAIELDNLILDRATALTAVRALSATIGNSFPMGAEPTGPTALLNRATAIMINRAIADAKIRDRLQRLDELVAEARRVAEDLRALSEDSHQYLTENEARVKSMRTFCVALSRRALADVVSRRQTRPEHPFRRL